MTKDNYLLNNQLEDFCQQKLRDTLHESPYTILSWKNENQVKSSEK